MVQPDGALLAVVGDVIGHDINAAASMGQVRTMLRMLARDRPESVAGTVRRLDAAATAMGVRTLATLTRPTSNR